jgi:hypothetical protein
VQSELLRWLRADNGLSVFPREVSLKRQVVDTLEEFLAYVGECRRSRIDCYASVFSLQQIDRSIFDTIFIDVDDAAAARIVEHILKENGLAARIYMSGRGVHFYLDFEPTCLPDYKYLVRRFIFEYLKLEEVDRAAVGDIRRMARVPFTYNTKVSKYMEPVCDERRLNGELPSILESLRVVKPPITPVAEKEIVAPFKGERLPPCVEGLIRKVVETGNLEHCERLLLATYLLKRFTFEEVKRLFMLCSDYREDRTTYQLEWLAAHDYEPYKCERIKGEFKICPLEGVCEYYPWMGKVV